MSNPYNKFEDIVQVMKGDFDKFYDKENNAAGTRVRKALQDLAALCKEVRKDVTDVKNARKEAK